MTRASYLLAAILVAYLPVYTHAHGRLLRPSSRMSGYLQGLAMPPNYNDHEMNCGGREVQWDESGGKCGICGEPWPGPKNYERPNGIMVQHQIKTATYLENQVFVLRLQITVTHKGWHEFRICNVATSGGVEATQKCLDRTLLADENGQTRFYNGTTTPGYFDFYLVLPEGLTCNHCVIQWKWKCGNDWGCENNGRCCVGCGERQEEFYGCSDVTINSRNTRFTTTQPTTRTTRKLTTWRYPYTSPSTTRRLTTWRYPYTSPSTTRRPITYSTRYPWVTSSTRAPTIRPTLRPTLRPTTRPTTRRTTRPTPTVRTTSRYTTTTAVTKPTFSNYNYNILYDYWRRNPKNIPYNIINKLPGPNTNYNPPTSSSRSAEDTYMNMILGRNVIVVNTDGLSIPVPMIKNTPTDSTTNITSDYIRLNRYCAFCQYYCIDQCHFYCADACILSQVRTTYI